MQAATVAIDRVFLVGMPGAGKTTVGRLLAAATGLRFVDCDVELERRAGVPVATVFELEGEAGFREREAQLLAELTACAGVLLATGGGAVLRAANRELLHTRGFVVYLDAAADEILRRTRHDGTRPLLQGGDRRARIAGLLAQREPLYREVAHCIVRSGAANPRRLVETMLAQPPLSALAVGVTP